MEGRAAAQQPVMYIVQCTLYIKAQQRVLRRPFHNWTHFRGHCVNTAQSRPTREYVSVESGK